jgi:hypothetical protein
MRPKYEYKFNSYTQKINIFHNDQSLPIHADNWGCQIRFVCL